MEQIVVSENAGAIDTLTAAGRYAMVLIAAVPMLLTVIGTHDLVQIIAFLQGADGVKLVAALVGLGTIAYGLIKTHKRGRQVADVAASPEVPQKIAALK
jgi:hypothetical protein